VTRHQHAAACLHTCCERLWLCCGPCCLQVPGLLQCLCSALETSAAALGDVSPLGWLALNTALHVPGARQNESISRMADALATQGGATAKAAAQIRMLLAPAQGSSASSAQPMDTDGPAAAPAGEQAEGGPAVVAVEDLWQTAGGRHDNDHQDYRDIKIMVTSEEVRRRTTARHVHAAVCVNSSAHQARLWPAACMLCQQL
jgi:hypothetical protein